MSVDYNDFAETFSNSRKNMKWEEIDYFISFLKDKEKINLLDIGCGNGRFLGVLKDSVVDLENYIGIDLSTGLLTEAKKTYPKNIFLNLDMTNLSKIKQKFSHIFFIASFHHLNNLKDRKKVLKNAYKLLDDDGTIFMTNWSLNSGLNNEKYEQSQIEKSKNEFGGLDYLIKIGDFNRYYHSFTLSELEYLFTETGFEIIENREFENKRNFVSIIKKKLED